MAVLITGGPGVFGAEVARLLLDQGAERVVLFDRAPRPGALATPLSASRSSGGDLGIFGHVLDAVQHPTDGNLSPRRHALPPLRSGPPAAIQSNALGTFHVLEAARLFAVPQVLFASSIGTYRDILATGRWMTRRSSARPSCTAPSRSSGNSWGASTCVSTASTSGDCATPSSSPQVSPPRGCCSTPPGRSKPRRTACPSLSPSSPGTGPAVLYVKDAARAMVELAAAPKEQIRAINYLVTGTQPAPHRGRVGRPDLEPCPCGADRLCPRSRAASASRPVGTSNRRWQRACRVGLGSQPTG